MDGQYTLRDLCAEWPKRSNGKIVGEKIGFQALAKHIFFQSVFSSFNTHR